MDECIAEIRLFEDVWIAGRHMDCNPSRKLEGRVKLISEAK